MTSKVLVAVALVAITVTAPGCSRLARAAIRGSRTGSSYNSSRTVRPEDMRISIAELDAASVKILNGHRAKWAGLVEKYNAADAQGAAQVLAVLEGYNNAHWAEKPKPEDVVEPLGVAIGDVLKQDGQVSWVLAEGDTVCLCSANGKVAVAPVGIADAWLSSHKAPLDKLVKDVAAAVRGTTGEPVLIGFDEERKYDPSLR